MSVDKPNPGAGRHGAPPLYVRLAGFLVFGSPLLIVALIIGAIEWGVGLRIIYEAFQWGWDLLGF